MPKVQIIVPTINLWAKYTKPCIDSIKTKYEHRILLIDNGSTDETVVEASKLVSNTFAHKRNEDRWGCAQSWNYGIQDAFDRGYDYAFVINNDVLLHPEAIDKLIERFEYKCHLHPESISEVLTTDFPIHSCTQKELALATCMDVTGECDVPNAIFSLSTKEKESVPETEHPCFSGFMINKMCWDTVGKLDEAFKPAYYEDNDYHYRINLKGLKAIVVPTSLFYHYGSRTNLEAYGKPFIDSSKNHQYYVLKWGGNPGKETFKTPFNK